MAKPVIGIIGNAHLINDEYPVQAVGVSNIEAVADLTGAIPLMVPALPRVGAISDLIEACDGFVFTGGRPNVHPSHYGHEPTEKHGAFDPDRDAVTLPLIRECVARGVPVFGICRGFQEFNVAFGGTLHPEIREIPGRMNHRMPPDGTLEEKFEHRHIVSLSDGGQLPPGARRARGDGELAARPGHPRQGRRGSSSRATRPTRRPRRSSSTPRPASPWRCSGTRSGTPPTTRCRGRCSRPSAPRSRATPGTRRVAGRAGRYCAPERGRRLTCSCSTTFIT